MTFDLSHLSRATDDFHNLLDTHLVGRLTLAPVIAKSLLWLEGT